MFTKNWFALVMVVLAVCVLAVPSAVRAEYITGTVSWNTDHTVTDDMIIGNWGVGVLNHTAGTVSENTPYTFIVGQGNQSGGSAYNMSGTASFTSLGGTDTSAFVSNHSCTGATWSLADSATATVGALTLGRESAANGVVSLAGDASFTASSLTVTSGYVTFASGCEATLTVANKVLSDYQSLVSSGAIRVNGVVQSDFSAFRVVDTHTLLLVPEPSTMTLLAVGLAGLLAYAWRKRK